MFDLKVKYEKEAVPRLKTEFKYVNSMMVPKITKVVVNRGIGEATQNTKLIDSFVEELEAIVGQKVMITKSKKSIATFKVREGQAIGCKVTLRKAKMYHFLNKFINIALPKVRDFRGVNKTSFDGRGNYTIGITEQIIFPEIRYEKITQLGGMDITICTSAKTDAEAFVLLEALGMPFRK